MAFKSCYLQNWKWLWVQINVYAYTNDVETVHFLKLFWMEHIWKIFLLTKHLI